MIAEGSVFFQSRREGEGRRDGMLVPLEDIHSYKAVLGRVHA